MARLRMPSKKNRRICQIETGPIASLNSVTVYSMVILINVSKIAVIGTTHPKIIRTVRKCLTLPLHHIGVAASRGNEWPDIFIGVDFDVHEDRALCREEAVNAGLHFIHCVDAKGINLESAREDGEIRIIIQINFRIILLEKHMLPLAHHAQY